MKHTTVFKGAALSSLLIALNTMAAPEANVSYDYVGLNYLEQDLDDFDCNQDGLTAYASSSLAGPWFVTGSVTDVSGNKGCGSTTLSAAGGYHMPLTAGWDVYGTAGVLRTDPDNGSSDTGLMAAAGIRGWLIDKLEAKAELSHQTTFDDTTQLTLGANYWFASDLAATLDTHVSDEGHGMAVGARMNF